MDLTLSGNLIIILKLTWDTTSFISITVIGAFAIKVVPCTTTVIIATISFVVVYWVGIVHFGGVVASCNWFWLDVMWIYKRKSKLRKLRKLNLISTEHTI